MPRKLVLVLARCSISILLLAVIINNIILCPKVCFKDRKTNHYWNFFSNCLNFDVRVARAQKLTLVPARCSEIDAAQARSMLGKLMFMYTVSQ